MSANPEQETTELMTRILIVDDHEIVREGIRRLLNMERPEWVICGEAGSGAEAIGSVSELRPDVVILDITMPGMNGLEAAKRISKLGLSTRVLIFTMHESDRLIAEIRGAGAQGYIQKSQAARDLVHAVEIVVNGGTFFSEQVKT
jgi:DNA-binding NarL/FixJ family response regulator